jgi:hypothetical protein
MLFYGTQSDVQHPIFHRKKEEREDMRKRPLLIPQSGTEMTMENEKEKCLSIRLKILVIKRMEQWTAQVVWLTVPFDMQSKF